MTRRYNLDKIDDDTFVVWDGGHVVAKLGRTLWGKFKIVGEDVYAKTPEELVARLEARQTK